MFDAQGHETSRSMWMIHIWPSRAVEAQSWTWTRRQRDIYQRVVRRLSMLVSCYLIGIEPAASDDDDDLACVEVEVRCRGTSLHITIVEFTGTDGPGPGDGTHAPQPHPVSGLVLSLGGSGRLFRLSVICGDYPVMPDINTFNSYDGLNVFEIVDGRPIIANAQLRITANTRVSNIHYLPLAGPSRAILEFGPKTREKASITPSYASLCHQLPACPDGVRFASGDAAPGTGSLARFSVGKPDTGKTNAKNLDLKTFRENYWQLRPHVFGYDDNPIRH